VLEFDDNDVDCERDDEIVVFDESDCGIVVELVVEVDVVVEEVETDENIGVEIGVLDEVESEISKISTISKIPFALFNPPPKNILFIDDVDART
jgi:hypothetical protein